MNKLLTLTAAIAAISLVTTTSCKKKEDKLTCRLTAIVPLNNGVPYNDSVVITYNAAGKIASAGNTGNGGYTTTFIYAGNIITAQTSTAGSPNIVREITLNASGNIAQVIEKEATGNVITTKKHHYRADNTPDYSTMEYGSYRDSTFYDYKNGNLVKEKSSVEERTYTYYEDKESQTGDPLKIGQFYSYGGYVISNKNLVKAISIYNTTSSNQLNYKYEYDNNGNITKMTTTNLSASGQYTSENEYRYSCD